MKKPTRIALTIMAGMALLTACQQTGSTDSQAADQPAAQGSRKAIFENEYAAVMRVILQPGEELPRHEGPPRLIYSLSDYTIQWKGGDAEPIEKTWKAGDVHFHESGELSVKNIGNQPAEWMAFVRLGEQLPQADEAALEHDAASLHSEYANVLIDNALFRMMEVRLPAGQKLPMHAGVNRMVYSLSDYALLCESTAEGTTEKPFKTGDIQWCEPDHHAMSNQGETQAHFLVVAYK
jgi:quercetin dioxygenase-like cupin family protein